MRSAVLTANARAHKETGWFRNVRPDELPTAVYAALFARNPRVKPEMADAVFGRYPLYHFRTVSVPTAIMMLTRVRSSYNVQK